MSSLFVSLDTPELPTLMLASLRRLLLALQTEEEAEPKEGHDPRRPAGVPGRRPGGGLLSRDGHLAAPAESGGMPWLRGNSSIERAWFLRKRAASDPENGQRVLTRHRTKGVQKDIPLSHSKVLCHAAPLSLSLELQILCRLYINLALWTVVPMLVCGCEIPAIHRRTTHDTFSPNDQPQKKSPMSNGNDY